MNIIVAFKEFILNLSKKPLHKMTMKEALQRYESVFQKRQQQVEEERATIQQVFPLQQKEFAMRLEKASTDFHLKGMLALVVNMKKNGMFWTEGARITAECEKSIRNIQEFRASHQGLLHSNQVLAVQQDEAAKLHFAEIQKSEQLTQKHLDYLQSDGDFIKKDLIARAKKRLEEEAYHGLRFEEYFQKKKEWVAAEIQDIDLH